jgi:type II secretory pathway predicted ATPase ExeA
MARTPLSYTLPNLIPHQRSLPESRARSDGSDGSTASLPRALNNAAIAALTAAASAGKALVDDDCTKKAVAELTSD